MIICVGCFVCLVLVLYLMPLHLLAAFCPYRKVLLVPRRTVVAGRAPHRHRARPTSSPAGRGRGGELRGHRGPGPLPPGRQGQGRGGVPAAVILTPDGFAGVARRRRSHDSTPDALTRVTLTRARVRAPPVSARSVPDMQSTCLQDSVREKCLGQCAPQSRPIHKLRI